MDIELLKKIIADDDLGLLSRPYYRHINLKDTKINRAFWSALFVDISTMLFFINYKKGKN